LFAVSKIFHFFASLKSKAVALIKAGQISEKFLEKVWRLKKRNYFCSPKIKGDKLMMARSSSG